MSSNFVGYHEAPLPFKFFFSLFSIVFYYAIIFQLNLVVSLFIEIEGEPLRVEYDDHTHTPSRMYGVQSVVECVLS